MAPTSHSLSFSLLSHFSLPPLFWRSTPRPPAACHAFAAPRPCLSRSFSASPRVAVPVRACRGMPSNRHGDAVTTRPTAPHPRLTLESPRPLSPRRMLALPSPSSPPCAQKSPKPSPLSQRPTAARHSRRRPLLQRSHHLRYPSAQAEPGNRSVASRWSSQARSPPPQATGELPPRHPMAAVALLPRSSLLRSPFVQTEPENHSTTSP